MGIFGPPQIATCRCGAPLVATFHWYKKEFYCLDCGRLYEFLEPIGVEETPELLARMEAYEAEWKEHASDLITPQAWLEACPLCKDPKTGKLGTSHDRHATNEQYQAHERALNWIKERVRV